MPTTRDEKERGFVSVTEVLDFFQHPKLVEWKIRTGAREAKRQSTMALKIGARVDELVKGYFKGVPIKLGVKDQGEVRSCIEGFQKWVKDFEPKVTSTGGRFYDEGWMVTGEHDLVVDGDTIVDIKCAGSIKDNYWIQTAVYAKFNGCDKIGVLRLDKSLGIYDYKVRQADPELVGVFEGLLTAYRFFNRGANGS